MTNINTILILTFVAILTFIGFVAYNENHRSSADKISNNVNEITEEIVDEIDDATTN
jgi:hypothetical protein